MILRDKLAQFGRWDDCFDSFKKEITYEIWTEGEGKREKTVSIYNDWEVDPIQHERYMLKNFRHLYKTTKDTYTK